jgi:DNA-binding MarR family transcriptional regulator
LCYFPGVPTDAASRHRVNEAIASLTRFANSRGIDRVHAARSGIALSMAAIGVLGRVVEQSPIGLGDLRAVTRLQPTALSRHIRILEEGQYIERTGNPLDGRAAIVRATDRGREAHRRVFAVNDELLSAQLVDWTATELNHLAGLMERLDEDLRSREKRAAWERRAPLKRHTPYEEAVPAGLG